MKMTKEELTILLNEVEIINKPSTFSTWKIEDRGETCMPYARYRQVCPYCGNPGAIGTEDNLLNSKMYTYCGWCGHRNILPHREPEDIEKMKRYIANYCDECGSCENCVLNTDGAPVSDSCFTWATENELIANYNWIREWS